MCVALVSSIFARNGINREVTELTLEDDLKTHSPHLTWKVLVAHS